MPHKSFHNDVLDKGLEQISNSANWGGSLLRMVLCAGNPANQSDAATLWPTGNRVSDEIVMAGGDFTLADKAGGGREVTVAAKSGSAQVSVPAIDSGTATSGTSTTLVDSGQGWGSNAHVDKVVVITGGTGAGQTRLIASNTPTVLTVATAWATNPDATSVYEIREDLHIVFYDGGIPRLLMVTDETSDQVITNGNPINVATFKFGFNDPV